MSNNNLSLIDEEHGLSNQDTENTPLLKTESVIFAPKEKRWDVQLGIKKNKTVQGRHVPSLPFGKKKSRRFHLLVERADGEKDLSALSQMTLFSGDVASLLILCRRGDVERDDDDETIVSGLSNSSLGSSRGDLFDNNNQGWVEQFAIPLKDLKFLDQNENKLSLSIMRKGSRYEQPTTFESTSQASQFIQSLAALQDARVIRAKSLLTGELENIDGIKYFIEIGSARNLKNQASLAHHTNPYCVVRIGSEEIHRTDVIKNSLDPTWTVATKSLFLSETSVQYLIKNGVVTMTFEIMDQDLLKTNVSLGYVNVPLINLFNSSGDTLELDLKHVKASFDQKSQLTVKCRKATKMDLLFFQGEKKFLEELGSQHGLKCPAYVASPPRDHGSSSHRRIKNTENENLVIPPDPFKKGAETWLSKEEMEIATNEPSRYWTQAGSGKLGYLFLEVLGCDGLPDKDRSISRDNTSDPFVTAVFEDVMVSTSVIDNTQHPRYMPWTQRAFMFNIDQMKSSLFLAVHDYDTGTSWHDFIGKVSINLTNIKPGMVHVLKYNLLYSSRVTPRHPSSKPSCGTITIRLSIEWKNSGRQGLFNTFSPRKTYHVNTEKKRDFYLAQHAILGQPDFMSFSIEQIKRYREEISGAIGVLLDVKDALVSVLLWRSTFDLPGCRGVKIPLHSMFAFGSLLLIRYSIHYIPFVCFITMWWIMLALLGHSNRHSTHWERPRSFAELLQVLIFGKPVFIAPTLSAPDHEDVLFDEEYKKQRRERVKNLQEKVASYAKVTQDYVLLNYEAMTVDELSKGEKLNPMKKLLYPLQNILGVICNVQRLCTNILSWQRSDIAFWITFFFLLSALVSLCLPWEQIWAWTGMVVEWTLLILLGPWMKLVDVFIWSINWCFSSIEKDIEKKEKKLELARSRLFKRKEDFMKYSEMMKHLFGKYLLCLPSSQPYEQFNDFPLQSSYSTPIPSGIVRSKDVFIKNRVMGVGFDLDMIPTLSEAAWLESNQPHQE